jgi:hypothetical protein
MEGPELKALFCERFKCPPSEYEVRALKRCLYWHARLLGPFVRLLNAKFFLEDLQLIRALGAATHWRDARGEILTFQDANRTSMRLLRTGLKIRVSGRKATDLAKQLFSEKRQTDSQP